MTSRLRKRLDNLGGASDGPSGSGAGLNSNLDESFCLIGTPLPSLADTKRDKNEFVPLHQQEVRDEQGRRRFHGAFTGGWSAGYYNTVGSKEGWAPATFKSSRNNRATSNRTQTAEDFMDEEDLADLKSARKLENTDTFRDKADWLGTAGELKGADNALAAFASLIQPASTSIGEKLLMRMGWKPGQGIGPRVTAQQLLRQRRRVASRLHVPVDDEQVLQAAAPEHRFAPRDSQLLDFTPKGDRVGLGWDKPVTIKASSASQAGQNLSAGFGFGNEEADEDDIDVYASGRAALPSLSKERPRQGDTATHRPPSNETWNDGRPLPSGFILAPESLTPDKWYDFPPISEGWRPRPARVWKQVDGGRWDKTAEAKANIEPQVQRPQLSADQRGSILGEQQLPTTAPATTSIESHSSSAEVDVPPLSPRTATAALHAFIPYGENPAKQDRYRSYLNSQVSGTKPSLLPGPPEAAMKELNEFVKSASMYKPLSLAMANRFTSSKFNVQDTAQAKPGLHVPDPSLQKEETQPQEPQPSEQLTPAQQAARSGMYGALTRRSIDWAPNKLLCKRFGVADPYPDGVKAKEVKPLLSSDLEWQTRFIQPPGNASAVTEPHASGTESTTMTKAPDRGNPSINEVGLADDDNQGRDILTYEKPEIDVFKAIFADSDSESDDDQDAADRSGANRPPATSTAEVDRPIFIPKITKQQEGPKKQDDVPSEVPSPAPREEKKKKKKANKALMSFEVDEEEDPMPIKRPEKRAKASDFI